MAVGKYDVSYRDYSKEISTFAVYCAELSAANFAAVGAQLQTLGTATNALSLGQPAKSTLIAQINTISAAAPSDVNAQRERKWLVRYTDDVTNQIYTLEIPCADLAGNLAANSDMADPTSTEWAAWITAFEAVAKSWQGNAVSFLDAQHVGRKS